MAKENESKGKPDSNKKNQYDLPSGNDRSYSYLPEDDYFPQNSTEIKTSLKNSWHKHMHMEHGDNYVY